MGKKKKNKNSFLKQNKLLLAVLGGVAAGISLAGILGTEKAKQIVDTLGNSVGDFTHTLKDQIAKNDSFPLDSDIKTRKASTVGAV